MTMLFGEYELLLNSGLFDAEFYLSAYPQIAKLNIDPLMHYIERGGRERRDPSASFNTGHYLRQCEEIGEAPPNPLYHYLTVGVARGLTTIPGAPSPGKRHDRSKTQLSVDVPRIVGGVAETPVRGGLSVVGWCIADSGIDAVHIDLDGKRVATARYGLRRPDVAAAHPSREGSLLSGYAAHLPPKVLSAGPHRVTVSVFDRDGYVTATEFRIVVQDAPEGVPPWALRTKMTQAEVDLKTGILRSLNWRPAFRILMPVTQRSKTLADARRTIERLRDQKYTSWELHLVGCAGGEARNLRTLSEELLEGFESIANQVRAQTASSKGVRADRRKAQPRNATTFTLYQVPGDELGCDALLELALSSGFNPEVDLWYCDERRPSPADGRPSAFFKPGWSPDLLLSTNYLGRAWCARQSLVERVDVDLTSFCQLGEYQRALLLTEAAQAVGHVPKVLHQRGDVAGDSDSQEHAALADALERRMIDAEVLEGTVPKCHRVKRKVPQEPVSIIITTCAAKGSIRSCLDTLRDRTDYRGYEIICVENITENPKKWRDWLRSRANVVISTRQPFNWAKFNNDAAARASGAFLLFLNDDTQIIDPDWLQALLEHARRAEVGAVGPLLLYPDRSVQQAGIFLDYQGRARHAFRHLAESDAGYFGLARVQRNVLGVTGVCLMTRHETFKELGRFDESRAIINSDLDYCLRAWKKGLINVYTPHARLIHHEIASRAEIEERPDSAKFHQRWRDVVVRGDPYFNPNLSRDHDQWVPDHEPLETVFARHPLYARDAIRRILVVKLDHIGDCISALPALRRLHDRFPDARISVLAGRASFPIWNAEASIDETIEFGFFHPRSGLGKLDVTDEQRKDIEKALCARRFDLAIDLRKQPDTREVLELTGARILAGFDHQGRFPWLDVALEWDEDVPLRSKHGHVADDLICLVEAVATRGEKDPGVAIKPPKGALKYSAAGQQRLFSRPLICIHPASGSPMRQWPLAKFSQLIDMLLDLKEYNVALIGGNDERDWARQVLESVSRPRQVFDLIGEVPLDELPELLGRTALFVGNNSGPQHMAAALGIPTIGIHSGVVDATECGPLGPKSFALRKSMVCSPCFLQHAEDCHRAVACMTELHTGFVYDACVRALSDVPRMRANRC